MARIMEGAMSRLTYDAIYRMWKHGEYLGGIGAKKLQRALKANGIQAFLTEGESGQSVWFYVPEENKMYEVDWMGYQTTPLCSSELVDASSPLCFVVW